MIKKCTCKHKFQDEKYGPNQRVHNFALKGNQGHAGWRCTVCSDVKPAGSLKDVEVVS
mgnify:FL=1|jgi:hypothetical protein